MKRLGPLVKWTLRGLVRWVEIVFVFEFLKLWILRYLLKSRWYMIRFCRQRVNKPINMRILNDKLFRLCRLFHTFTQLAHTLNSTCRNSESQKRILTSFDFQSIFNLHQFMFSPILPVIELNLSHLFVNVFISKWL